LAEVRLQEGESLENALRRFQRTVQQEDVIKEIPRHSFSLTPGEEKRVKEAREHLNKYANGTAMPALALKDNKTNVWEPVGEENVYAILNDGGGYVLTDVSGYMVVLCDKNGISKAIARGLDVDRKDAIVKMLQADNLQEFKGQVSLPV